MTVANIQPVPRGDAAPVVRVAHMLQGCRTLGPGARSVVWVRGCARRCPGCIASPILDDGPSLKLRPDELAARLLATTDEGVTFSGGEPFEQARELATVGRELRAAGRSVMVYSGFTIDELRSSENAGVRALLDVTDILVDGPFERERQTDLLWRGSANQRIHLLTARYAHLASELDGAGVGVELRVDSQADLFWAGVPGRDFVGQLRRAAEPYGIILTGREGVWA
jgi:anaerobic ribonucleoside-triphosphate reductase activating protein